MAEEYPVVLRYTKQETTDLFKTAFAGDRSKGGHYDIHGSVIDIWPDVEAKSGKRRKPKPMGAFHFQMRNASGIWKISLNRGYGLADMLYELLVLEMKALGQVKHGKLATDRPTQTRAQQPGPEPAQGHPRARSRSHGEPGATFSRP